MLQPTLPDYKAVFGNGPDLAAPYLYLAKADLRLQRYADAEQASAECFRLQDGKVPANSTRVAVCHVTWAQALAGQHKDAQALQQVLIAEDEYARTPRISPAEKVNLDTAQALRTELQARLRK